MALANAKPCECPDPLVFDQGETCNRCGRTVREVRSFSVGTLAEAIVLIARGDRLKHDGRSGLTKEERD